MKKINIITDFCIFELVSVPNFNLSKIEIQICTKRVFPEMVVKVRVRLPRLQHVCPRLSRTKCNFTTNFCIARYHCPFNVSSAKVRRGNKQICIYQRQSLMNFCKHLPSKMIQKLSLTRVKLYQTNSVPKNTHHLTSLKVYSVSPNFLCSSPSSQSFFI